MVKTMMVSMETYLLRGKRRMERWLDVPWVRSAGSGAGYLVCGALLSGAALWGRMQPIALGFITAASGWRCLWAALGSALGYRLFWGLEGLQGSIWALGMGVMALILPFFDGAAAVRRQSAPAAACLVGVTGLYFGYRWGPDPAVLPERILLAAVCVWSAERIWLRRDRFGLWLWAAMMVMGLSRLPLPQWLDPGSAAIGLLSAAAPLPAAALAALCGDLARGTGLTAAVCLAYFLQLPGDRRYAMAAPGCACALWMLLRRQWDVPALAAMTAGGLLGGCIPWQILAVPRHGSLGSAQVKLEQGAAVLTELRQQLLEYRPVPVDLPALLDQLRTNTCGSCSLQPDCPESLRLEVRLLEGDESFPCRRSGRMAGELRRSRDQLRRIRAERTRQAEFRAALANQYGFLSELLHTLSDRLTQRENSRARYRVRLSVRSRSREIADGDRVLAFPGVGQNYYILLCDGMGTGLGAAEEARRAGSLIRRMLTAGLSPGSALGAVNTQLTLLCRSGAVTVDLTQLQLDSGSARLYKWGAGPSWLLRRGKVSCLSQPPSPPLGRESAHRLSLTGGDTLVMASDGITAQGTDTWPNTDPAPLAQHILDTCTSGGDDATVVAIRIESC